MSFDTWWAEAGQDLIKSIARKAWEAGQAELVAKCESCGCNVEKGQVYCSRECEEDAETRAYWRSY